MSSASWHTAFTNLLNYLNMSSTPIILLGNFNLDFSKDKQFSDEVLVNFGLQQYMSEPTQVTSTSATLLDHVFFNSYHVTCTETFEPGVADHRAVCCCLSRANLYTQEPLQEHKCTNFRSINKVSEEELEIAFESIDWSKALYRTSVDNAAAVFVKLFTSAWTLSRRVIFAAHEQKHTFG